jgi:hypothetical protein
VSAALNAIRDLVQKDVGGRGLRTDPADNLVTACPDDFAAACRSLAAQGNSLAIVTGFYIAHAEPPCGETDGPLGALFLARALVPLGIRVVLATDDFCLPALRVGLAAAGLRKAVPLVPLPSVEEAGRMSGDDYWTHVVDRTGPLTHLLACERVGPSHTLASVQAQRDGDRVASRFLEEVPGEGQDRCYSMRGRDVSSNTSPVHRLFEQATCQMPRVTTIGIGDGGNEIGMGKIPWDVISRNIPNGGRVACRVPTDYLVVCGVSNWGAYALATGVRLLRGAEPDADLFDPERERAILQAMIEGGPLVDGATGEPTLSVDGLSFERYVQPLQRLANWRPEPTRTDHAAPTRDREGSA